MSDPTRPTQPRTVAVADLPEDPQGAGAPVYLDVREDEEFAAGHVPGALHVPLAELPQRAGELPDAPVLVLCRTGGRAGKAAAWLQEHGCDASVVQGGSVAWAQAGRPLVAEGEEPEGGPYVR